MQYRPDHPVLNGLSLTIQAKQKARPCHVFLTQELRGVVQRGFMFSGGSNHIIHSIFHDPLWDDSLQLMIVSSLQLIIDDNR